MDDLKRAMDIWLSLPEVEGCLRTMQRTRSLDRTWMVGWVAGGRRWRRVAFGATFLEACFSYLERYHPEQQ